MKLKVEVLGIESGGKPIVFLNNLDSQELGISVSSRVRLRHKKELTAIVNLSSTLKKGHIGINEEVKRSLSLKSGSIIDVEISEFPKSLQFIRNKLAGKKLLYKEIYEIVNSVVKGNLNEIEVSAFVTALHIQGLDLDEATSLSSAMVDTGKRLNFNKKIIVDKHSIGGVPGDKTTLLVVPIVAAAGLTIPKTSSRAITSAGGTADRAEALMPVELHSNEMQKVVKKCNGCIVWGGALDLAPADDIFVRTEYSLYIDPLLLPSIMSKKKAVGATHLVVDIPTGRGAKVKTIGEGDLLAKDLIELGKRLGIRTHCVLTYGEQPVGYAIGPTLEAKEALEVLMNKIQVPDLKEKACSIAGSIFEMAGKKNGYKLAKDIMDSGKAEEKLREIINSQGGNGKIRPEDLETGQHSLKVRATKSGNVLWIDNNILVEVARASGAPKDKGAGLVLEKKIGDSISEGELLFTVYSKQSRKIDRVHKFLEENNPIGIGTRAEMVIHQVKETPVVKRAFVLDR